MATEYRIAMQTTLCTNVPVQKPLSESNWTFNHHWVEILRITADAVLLSFLDKQLQAAPVSNLGFCLAWTLTLDPFPQHPDASFLSLPMIVFRLHRWSLMMLFSSSLKPRNTSRNPPTTLKVLIHFPNTGGDSFPYPQHLPHMGTNSLDY